MKIPAHGISLNYSQNEKCFRKKFVGKIEKHFMSNNISFRWPGGSVGIATGSGLDGPGIESRWRRDFPHLSRPALRPTQHPVEWAPGLPRG
jgi:hypothetical protein